MRYIYKCSGLIYFIWLTFSTNSENIIDKLEKEKKVLDDKIKNITDVLAEIKESMKKKSSMRTPPIAEKTYYIPLGKIHLSKFIIDMTVDMNYLKNSNMSTTLHNITDHQGHLKATADVNAKLFDDDEDDSQPISRPVKKKRKSGHFEYFSPMFKVNLKALPVGVQLFVPIHKITSIYQMQKENTTWKNISTPSPK